MKHGSLCTGIGVFDLAFELAGFELVWQVEIEPFCNAILESHWPNVRRYTDVREVGKHNLEPVDILTAGFPCQDLSVAGKRAGLTGERSGLFFDIARVIGEIKPRWFVLENVPGLLSSQSGRDFGIVLSTLAELGYGAGYRILDSQFFGVAQRRRRVFIIGYLGNDFPIEVLFESPSSAGHSTQGEEARQEVAATLTNHFGGTSNQWPPRTEADNLIVAATLRGGGDTRASHRKQSGSDRATLIVSPPLRSGEGAKGHPGDPSRDEKRAAIVCAPADPNGVRNTPGTPEGLDNSREMEESLLPKGLDSARYRALGNAVTLPVAHWIAQGIAEFERSR